VVDREIRSSDKRGRIPRFLVEAGFEHPWLTVWAWLFVGTVSVIGVGQLAVETSTDSVLDRSDPAWMFYQRSLDRFGGDEIITILLSFDDPYDQNGFFAIQELTKKLEFVPGVRRVDSLSTVPLIREDSAGDLALDGVFASTESWSSVDSSRMRALIKSDSIAPGILISTDGRHLAINVVLEKNPGNVYDQVLRSIDQILEGQAAAISGVPIFRTETDRWTRRELLKFVPLTVLAIGLLMLALFRGSALALLPVVSSGLGSVLVLAAMGFTSTPLTISTVILPSILIALGCAYSMHMLTAYQFSSTTEEWHAKLLLVSTPIALSGLTTALGFLAIGFVGIESIRNIATFGAFGVLAVLTVTLTGIPAAFRLVPMRPIDNRVRRKISGSIAPRLVGLCIRRRRQVLLAWVVFAGATISGIIFLRNETDVILWFPKDHEIRADYDYIRENLSGISPMNIVISAPLGQRVSSPEVVDALAKFVSYLESLPSVGRAVSVSNLLSQIRSVIGGGSDAGLPESEREIEQLLLLLESSDYMSDLITADRSAANVVLRVNRNGSGALLGVAADAEAWWQRNGVSGYEAKATGIMYEFARSQNEITTGQTQGLFFVFISVGFIVFLTFRWAGLALATLAANVIPIAMGFGAMGFLGIPIDAGTVVVGCIAFGIGVDDTIHTATEFSSRIAAGIPNRDAILSAYENVLPAVFFTTAVTMTGFTVLGFSDFALIRNLGLVTSAVMALCLLADVLLFPSLLSLTEVAPGGGEG